MKLSFGIKKTKTSKVVSVKSRGFEKVEEDKEDVEIITGVDEKGIKGTKVVVEEKPLVIPLITTNRWDEKALDKKRAKVDDGAAKANAKQFSEDIQDEAAAALMTDANIFLDKQEKKGKKDQGLSIPILMQNKVPDGFEADEGALKVDIRPDSSKIEDYDDVPVEQFGLAMLRGMGFKAEEGIGKVKQKIDQIKVDVRPKGLGLGAIPVKKKIEAVKADAVVLMMKVGAYVRITTGPYTDRYGQVKSMDGDMGRLTVKWALGADGPPQEVMEAFVELVTRKQHDEIGRDISRKAKAAMKRKAEQEEEKQKQAEKLKQAEQESRASSSKTKTKDAKWCQAGLIVRFVGDKKSKHYKQKFAIVSVAQREDITCRNLETDRESAFDERDLETVIPRNNDQVVMVISGESRGAYGVMVDKIKEKERVMVEMLPDKKRIERFTFDEVCQFNATRAELEKKKSNKKRKLP